MFRYTVLRYLLYLLIIAACALVAWSIIGLPGIFVGLFLSFILLFLVRNYIKS